MKLSGWVWLWVGFCIAAIILSYGYFQFYKPNMDEAAEFNKNADLYKPLASAETKKKALKRVENAQKKVDEAAAKWNQYVIVKTPPKSVSDGGIDLAKNRYYLTIDAPKFRNSVQTAVNNQLRRGGVKVVQGVTVPFPPSEPGQIIEGYFNYPAYAFPVCIFSFGTVTVQGTYDQICANVKSWSSMPNYIAVTDGLAITGTSPRLTGTYNLTVVAMIRGDKVAPPIGDNVPGAPAAPGAPGGPGGRGGVPGIPPPTGGGAPPQAGGASQAQGA
ncbi:MAG: hypothetical protein ABUL72_02870 [Armatimonadota bacterium]